MIYTHVLKVAAGGTASPLDSLFVNSMTGMEQLRERLELPISVMRRRRKLETCPPVSCY
ncbi:MAG: hypothetical protein KA173_03740 [Rhodoferax sp.]|nr:hypothetical protein [Rhodoferax sp.]MBP7492811.1 hypothetical protein [Rhodoferax sp.]